MKAVSLNDVHLIQGWIKLMQLVNTSIISQNLFSTLTQLEKQPLYRNLSVLYNGKCAVTLTYNFSSVDSREKL